MDRRAFSKTVSRAGVAASLGWTAGAAGLMGVSPATWAQGGPIEGKQYLRLSDALPSAAPAGKVEVIEFFWYGCPHCFALEPDLEAWRKKLPADVVFRRVPVAFRKHPFEAHQRIYFALEALGQIDAMHAKVFTAIHQGHQKLDNADDIAAFMAKSGLDRAKFLDAFNSFGVQTKGRQAQQLADAYRIDGVPTLAIGGRYTTSETLAGGREQTLSTVDYLIARVRKGG